MTRSFLNKLYTKFSKTTEQFSKPPNAVPAYAWNKLTQEDKEAYFDLKESFYRSSSPILCKEKDKSTFPGELEKIRAYIESSSVCVQERCIIVGVAFQPSFVSVNIQRLKTLLNRCKSSINKGFQQINYISEKSQVKSHVVKSIPLLSFHPEETRQWTIRIPKNKSNDFASNLMQISVPQISTDFIPNLNFINTQIPNSNLTFPPQNFNNLLPTPCINSNNAIKIIYEQNFKPDLLPNSSNPVQQVSEHIKNDDNRSSSTIQNPPEIRLCNSQYIDSNLSIDDFDINNGHESNVNDDDSGILCSSCSLSENCVNTEIAFDFSPNFHYDEMYAEYHNHDDPQDDDIGLYNISDQKGSSIDIRKNFS